MKSSHRSQFRSLSIRLDRIQRVYGKDRVDDAGDDIVYALNLVSDYPNQHPYRFDRDLSHANPFYHVMIFEVEDMSELAFARLIERIAGLDLIDAVTSSRPGGPS